MLVEGVLAVIALEAVMVLAPGSNLASAQPAQVFAGGMGRFLSALGVPAAMGTHFGFLALSTFLLTTLDTCTRIARYIFQELFNMQGSGAPVGGTVASPVLPAFFVFVTPRDPSGHPIPAWRASWPVLVPPTRLRRGPVIRVGRDHGPWTSNETGVPANDAAVISSGTPGAQGASPSHSRRVANATGGTHRGGLAVNDERSRLASENK